MSTTANPPAETATRTPRQTVEAILEAAAACDPDRIRALLADDVVYENVGLPTFYRADTLRTAAKVVFRVPGIGFDYRVHRIIVQDNAVFTERTDVLIFGPLRWQVWVLGVTEIADGQVSAWRDYFDYRAGLLGLVRGLLGIAIPPLNRRVPRFGRKLPSTDLTEIKR